MRSSRLDRIGPAAPLQSCPSRRTVRSAHPGGRAGRADFLVAVRLAS